MKSRADQAVPEPATRTFDEAFAELNLTPKERAALVWHLAMLRARKTVEVLLPEADAALTMGFDPRDMLRDDGKPVSRVQPFSLTQNHRE